MSFVVVVAISWAAPAAYGGSQARGRIRAVATGLRQSHSNAGSEPRLQPILQLTAMPDRYGFNGASLNAEDSMHCVAIDPYCMRWSQWSEAKCIPIECTG